MSVATTVAMQSRSCVLETGKVQGKVLSAAEDFFLKGTKLFTEHRGRALQLFKTLFLHSAPCGFMFQHHIVNCTYLQLQLNSWMQHGKPSQENIKVF